MVASAATQAKLKLQNLLGVRSTKATNGGRVQGGKLTEVGRGHVVDRFLRGEGPSEIARAVGVTRKSVRKWINRFKAGDREGQGRQLQHCLREAPFKAYTVQNRINT